MVYFDYGQNRYVCSTPTVIPDIRAHIANWDRYHRATGIWPALSIITFLMRFILLIGTIIFAIWYGVAGHSWTKDDYWLFALGVALPLIFLWYLVERTAWNYDLRKRQLASNSDIWGLDQFPSTKARRHHQ